MCIRDSPWTDEMVSMATKYKNVYIDTSAYTPERYPESLIRFMKGPGKNKVLYGSNWPMISPQKCLSQLDLLDLPEDGLSAFLHDNAKKVFKLES